MYVVAELGIADLLADRPMSAAQLAQATGTHERSLYRVLRLLVALGVLREEQDGCFGLTVVGERLRSDVAASMRSWARLIDFVGAFPGFEPIVETIRTGRPGFDLAHGMPIFEYLSHHPQRAAGFQAAMSERTAAFAPSVAGGYDFSRMRTVVDVGGGTGTLLAAILQANGHLRGTLFDQPAVAAEAEEKLRAAGVADRCEVAGGDFFHSIPQGADCYILANVLHDWNDDHCRKILRNCHSALPENGKLIITESVLNSDGSGTSFATLMSLHMLVLCEPGARERTETEYAGLLESTGFTVERLVRTEAAG